MTTTIQVNKIIEDDNAEVIKWLESEYPRGIDLVYIDYRDSIEDAKDREKILQVPDEAYEIISGNNWIPDNQYQSIGEIEREYSEKHEGVELSEEASEALRDWCFEHDTSNPVKDLLKNVSREYMYYDTGLYFESLDYTDIEKEARKRTKAIAKKLKIDHAKHEKVLDMLVKQAYYGGQLVILFEASIKDFMEDAKYIKFNRDYEVCIMDRGQGSGDNTNIGNPLLFEFVRENLHTDKGDNGYSYAYDVCGLVGGIMNDGVMTNKKEQDVIRVKTNEARQAEREREAGYIKKWNGGKGECSFGDMNIKRHESASYRNDFPCGNKCEKCGNFWID